MKTLLIILTFLCTSDLFSQCYTPDTSKIPLSRIPNSYVYFTGNDTGCFLRSRYFDDLALNIDVAGMDTFVIQWKMKVRQVDSEKQMYVFGQHYGNDGWYISFNMAAAGWLAVTFGTSTYKLDSIGLYDSTWHTYELKYSYWFTKLQFFRDDTIRYNNSKFNKSWAGTSNYYTFAVGYKYARNNSGVPSDIPMSGYYFNGYIDFLKFYFFTDSHGLREIYNWSFNEAEGQYAHDSADYKVYQHSIPGDPQFTGKHLQNGFVGAQDKYDVVWFQEPTAYLACRFTALSDGVRAWVNGYTWWVTKVFSVSVWDSKVVVLGEFNKVNSSHVYYENGDEVHHVAVWNPVVPASWSTLGSGLNEDPFHSASYNGDLIVVGQFTGTIDGTPAQCIARWDGSSWSQLGSSGLTRDSGVSSGFFLKEWNGDLYVGGNFKYADGIVCNRIAKWSDSSNSYSALDSGLNANNVWAIEVYNDNLYAGGSFTKPVGSSIYCRAIMRWDGSDWSAVGTKGGADPNGTVRALCVYNGELWAAGDFITMDSITCNGIAKYNDSTDTWSAPGAGVDGFAKVIYNMQVYHNELYVTGNFYYMDGKPVNKICKWTGSEFCAISTGLDQQGKRMTVYNDELVVGGNFFEADGMPFNNVLRYYSGDNKDNHVYRSTVPFKLVLAQNYPNPFNPVTTIRYIIPKKELVTLKIYDILGREVKILVNEIKDAGTYSAEFDASNLASGIYFYKIASGDFTETRKMVLIK